jgi:hypothetical protein
MQGVCAAESKERKGAECGELEALPMSGRLSSSNLPSEATEDEGAYLGGVFSDATKEAGVPGMESRFLVFKYKSSKSTDSSESS